MEISVGAILEGNIKSITKFGAFVSLPGGRSGLVHISEIAHSYVADVKDFLTEGQEVKVKVVSIDEAGRINLSIKKAQPPQERTAAPRPAARPGNGSAPRANNGSAAPRQGYQPRPVNRAPQSAAAAPVSAEQSFEDKLKQFLSSSEGKMADLNRSIDGKRGGGRRRR
jgi:S1 RNA binding domain protein